MNKDDESDSWFVRMKQFIQREPQNQDDLVSLLRDANLRSLIDSDTLALLEGSIAFSQLRARDIMLPKNQMTCVNKDYSLDEVIQIVTQSGHSRFPVTGDNSEEIIGILHAKDLLRFQQTHTEELDIGDISRQVVFVPESKRLDSLLSEFRSNKNHMAIVVDEYGAIAGCVTIEDIIEQIIGDIEDEFDIDEEAYIKKHGEQHYIVKAHTPIEEFNEQLETNFSDDTYDTIGGIVMAGFGYLPNRDENIIINKFEFKVLNADARRIKLLECIDRRPKKQTTANTKGQ